MGGFRKEKLAELYRRVATDFLQKNARIPDAIFSVTDVQISDKLNRLTIYFAVWPDKKEKDMIKSLQDIKSDLRKEFADEVKTKFVPDVEFKLDESEKKRLHIEELLNKEK